MIAESAGMDITMNTRCYGGAVVGSKLFDRRMCDSASSPQQVFPALPARDSDVQSFQVLFHLLRPLLHRVFAEKFSHVGLELWSNQADDTFAHTRDSVIRILVEHFIPVFFHEGPRPFSGIFN